MLRTRYIDQDRAILKYIGYFQEELPLPRSRKAKGPGSDARFLALLSCSKFICAILEMIREKLLSLDSQHH